MSFIATKIAPSRQAAAAMLLFLAIGCGDGPKESSGRIRRVTLTGNYATDQTGQGWSIDREQIPGDAGDADFNLKMRLLIALVPSQPQVGFCELTPPAGGGGFKHVEEIPSNLDSCSRRADEPAH